MPFHRYQDPSYNLLGGAFPGTVGAQAYDRVNVVSGGVGGGNGSANADGSKSGGPNAGTYFVAFGEDATSSFANRGLRALAQNTDALDNILRGSVPYVVGAPYDFPSLSAEVVVTGDVFVGEFGALNTQENRDRIFQITYGNGLSIDGSGSPGTPVTCTLIHDGSGNNVLGTATDGFRNGAYFRLSSSQSTGGNGLGYTIYVGRRTSYANMLEARLSDLVAEHMRSRAFDGDLAKLFTQGLNGRYRKSTGNEGFDYDEPGLGATIQRDGKAVTVALETHPWEGAPSQYDDIFRAGFRTEQTLLGLAADPDQSGNIGFAHVTTRRSRDTGVEFGAVGRDAAAFAVLNPVHLTSPTDGSNTYYTYLQTNTPAVLNPSNIGADYVRVSSPYYFRNGGNTGVARYYDILLITRTEGTVTTTKPYVITSIVDDTTVAVSPLASRPGDDTVFTANTSATVQWVQPCEIVGGYDGRSLLGGPSPGGMSWKSLSITNTNRNRAGSVDFGYGVGGAEINCCNDLAALSINRFDPSSGTYLGYLNLLGDGSIEQGHGSARISLTLRSTLVTFATSITYTVDRIAGNSSVFFVEPGLPTTRTLTIQDSAAPGNIQPGFEFVFFIPNQAGSDITLATPAHWSFSGDDNIIPTTPFRTYKFVAHYAFETLGGFWRAYVTRTDY